MEATRDKIVGFSGSWSSGLATLVLENSAVMCENSQTARALDACFGGVVGSNHSVNGNSIEGKDIVYTMDDMGLILAGFTPYEDWLANGMPEIEVGQTIEIET